jgi:hypothetical protein
VNQTFIVELSPQKFDFWGVFITYPLAFGEGVGSEGGVGSTFGVGLGSGVILGVGVGSIVGVGFGVGVVVGVAVGEGVGVGVTEGVGVGLGVLIGSGSTFGFFLGFGFTTSGSGSRSTSLTGLGFSGVRGLGEAVSGKNSVLSELPVPNAGVAVGLSFGVNIAIVTPPIPPTIIANVKMIYLVDFFICETLVR